MIITWTGKLENMTVFLMKSMMKIDLQSWKCSVHVEYKYKYMYISTCILVHVHYTYVLMYLYKIDGYFLRGVCNMIEGLSANLIGRLKAQLGNSCLFGNLCAIFLGVMVVMLSNNQACERTERTEIEYCSDSSRGIGC